MRLWFQRSRALRGALVALSCLAVLGLVQTAAADDILGLRGLPFFPDAFFDAPAAAPPAAPLGAPGPRRTARRIWASSRARPLRIRLDRERHRTRHASRRHEARRVATASSRQARAVPARLLILPKPDRPALVTIYQDRTLRDGDAVMMADGISLYHGGATWPHQRADFVRLQFATNLGWSLRHTLADIDSAPPTRWSGLRSTTG